MTIRSRYLMAGASTAVAAVALLAAGCSPSSSSSAAPPPSTPPASGSPAVPPSATTPPATPSLSPSPSLTSAPPTVAAASPTPSSCASYAATHTFANVVGAKEQSNGSLTVDYYPATVVCGGPDDLHYNITTPMDTGTVTSSGTVQMLTGVVKEESVPHADVATWLAKDEWGRIFMVTGPFTAITTLTEMYHP